MPNSKLPTSVRVAHVPFGRIGVVAARNGALIEVFIPTYQDIILAEQQQDAYKKAYLISRTVLVDGAKTDVEEILQFFFDEMNKVLNIINKNTTP
jgi:hypothetical protein